LPFAIHRNLLLDISLLGARPLDDHAGRG
jgi:hypothetical protein